MGNDFEHVATWRPLGIMPYVGIYFGHAMSKACQYAIMDEKVCINMLGPFTVEVPLSGHRT